MSKKFKKYLSVLLATVLATGCLSAVVAFADDSVALNEMNFPDANFRAYLSETPTINCRNTTAAAKE